MIDGGSGNGCWGDGYGGRWVVEVVWVWKVEEWVDGGREEVGWVHEWVDSGGSA